MTLSVGDELFFVPVERRGTPHYLKVVKIGRKWITLNNGYIADINTLRVDGRGYSSPGRCYVSREAWEHAERLQQKWSAFRSQIERRYSVPEGMTIERLCHAAEIIGIALPD